MSNIHYPLTGDRRYTITKEFCGHDGARYVLRFCGEWVAQSLSRTAMVVRAVGHNSIRMGAVIVEEVANAN